MAKIRMGLTALLLALLALWMWVGGEYIAGAILISASGIVDAVSTVKEQESD